MSHRTAVPIFVVAIASCAPIGSRPSSDSVLLQSTIPQYIHHFPSAHLDSLALLPVEASRPAQLLSDRGGYSCLLIRRTSAGEVEVHTEWDDVFVVRAGRATLLTGVSAEGGRNTGPGERRGGRIAEPRRRTLNQGDVVVIPAGLAHQIVPDAGGAVTYLVVKASARPR